jgi:hypothetical protein
MTETDARTSAPDHRDRRAGLVLFGILLIVIGAVCALLAVVLLAGPLAMPGAGTVAAAPAPLPDRTLVPGIVTYVALAGLFVWLGAGSILARRWAPPLILTVGWLWLITGVVCVGASTLFLPAVFTMTELQSGPMPDGFRTAMTLGVIGILSLVMVILPGALVLFYRSRHVRATCVARDPVPRWTDGRPTSLIGLSLSLLLLALSLLPAVFLYNGMALCFGAIAVGAPGILVNLALAAIWCACAWSTLKLDPRGWWASAVSLTLATASAVVTLAWRDPADLSRAAGLPVEQVGGAVSSGSGIMIALALACWLSLIGSLLHVRKHFRFRG